MSQKLRTNQIQTKYHQIKRRGSFLHKDAAPHLLTSSVGTGEHLNIASVLFKIKLVLVKC